MAMRFYQLLEMFKEICQFERHKNAKNYNTEKRQMMHDLGLFSIQFVGKLEGEPLEYIEKI